MTQITTYHNVLCVDEVGIKGVEEVEEAVRSDTYNEASNYTHNHSYNTSISFVPLFHLFIAHVALLAPVVCNNLYE